MRFDSAALLRDYCGSNGGLSDGGASTLGLSVYAEAEQSGVQAATGTLTLTLSSTLGITSAIVVPHTLKPQRGARSKVFHTHSVEVYIA